MKILRKIFFLLCLPGLLFRSSPSSCFEIEGSYLEAQREIFIPRDEQGLINPWGYLDPKNIFEHLDGYIDHPFAFIDLITETDFLETLCDEEMNRVVDFVIFLLRYSVPKSRPDLKEKYEREIEELLNFLSEDEEEEDFQLLSNKSLKVNDKTGHLAFNSKALLTFYFSATDQGEARRVYS